MFEGINELRKVRVKGLLLALVGKWTIIDANRSIEEVGMEIRKLLGVS
jgi:thymidylate kinase